MSFSSLGRLLHTFLPPASLLQNAQQNGFPNPLTAVEIHKDGFAWLKPLVKDEDKPALLASVHYVYERIHTPGSIDPRAATQLLEAYAPHLTPEEAERFRAVVYRYLLACCRQDFVPRRVERFAATARRCAAALSTTYHMKTEDGRRPTPNQRIWKEKLHAASQLIDLVDGDKRKGKAERTVMLVTAAQTLTEAAWSSTTLPDLGDVLRVIQKKGRAISSDHQASLQIAVLLIRLAKSFEKSAERPANLDDTMTLRLIHETQNLLTNYAEEYAPQ